MARPTFHCQILISTIFFVKFALLPQRKIYIFGFVNKKEKKNTLIKEAQEKKMNKKSKLTNQERPPFLTTPP